MYFWQSASSEVDLLRRNEMMTTIETIKTVKERSWGWSQATPPRQKSSQIVWCVLAVCFVIWWGIFMVFLFRDFLAGASYLFCQTFKHHHSFRGKELEENLIFPNVRLYFSDSNDVVYISNSDSQYLYSFDFPQMKCQLNIRFHSVVFPFLMQLEWGRFFGRVVFLKQLFLYQII